MTKKCAAGEFASVPVPAPNVGAGVFVAVVLDVFFVFDVFFFVVDVFLVVGLRDAAAEPETNTAATSPSENIASTITTTANVLRRGVGLVTTHLPCRSRRSLPGAARSGSRSCCGLHARPGPRSSAEVRRRVGASRRCRRREAPPRRPPRPPRLRLRRGSCP